MKPSEPRAMSKDITIVISALRLSAAALTEAHAIIAGEITKPVDYAARAPAVLKRITGAILVAETLEEKREASEATIAAFSRRIDILSGRSS